MYKYRIYADLGMNGSYIHIYRVYYIRVLEYVGSSCEYDGLC